MLVCMCVCLCVHVQAGVKGVGRQAFLSLKSASLPLMRYVPGLEMVCSFLKRELEPISFLMIPRGCYQFFFAI